MRPNVFSTVTLHSYDKLLAELVAAPSISAPSADWDQSNEKVIAILHRWFSELGFKSEIHKVPNNPGKYNLIACLGEGAEGLVLSGHTDTVPFDASKWSSDPFTMDYRNERFYGLGSCDMKGFFPIIVEALRRLEGAELSQPLIVVATADEESSMSGARAIASSTLIQGRAAIIGEPTSIRPIRMHKGIMMQGVRISGQSGHSSNPELGNSALEAMHEMISELMRYRASIQQRFQHPGFEVTTPTLNFGHVHGGDSPNRICGHCELSFDLRLLPGMDSVSIRNEISGIVSRVSARRSIDVSLSDLIDHVDAFETAEHSDLVQSCEIITKTKAGAVSFATEAPFLSQLGFETIVMGAGSIDQAHQPDEFLAAHQVKPMADVLCRLIQKYCISEKESLA